MNKFWKIILFKRKLCDFPDRLSCPNWSFGHCFSSFCLYKDCPSCSSTLAFWSLFLSSPKTNISLENFRSDPYRIYCLSSVSPFAFASVRYNNKLSECVLRLGALICEKFWTVFTIFQSTNLFWTFNTWILCWTSGSSGSANRFLIKYEPMNIWGYEPQL